MKNLIRFVVVPIFLVGCFVVGYMCYTGMSLTSTNDNILFIQEHINAKGNLVDYKNEIGVNGVEDIKLFVKEGKIDIKFGKIALTWETKDFVSTENQKELKKIGIQTYIENTGRIHVLYNNEEVARWVH